MSEASGLMKSNCGRCGTPLLVDLGVLAACGAFTVECGHCVGRRKAGEHLTRVGTLFPDGGMQAFGVACSFMPRKCLDTSPRLLRSEKSLVISGHGKGGRRQD